MIQKMSSSPTWWVRAIESLCRLFERVAIAMLLITTTLIVLQVVARNLWQMGLPWADELARYGGLGIVYLAIPLLLLENGHIAVDLFISRVKGRSKQALLLVNEIIVLGFCALFLTGGYQFLLKAGKFSTPALQLPNLLFYLPAMLGMLLFTLVAVLRLCRVLGLVAAPVTPKETTL